MAGPTRRDATSLALSTVRDTTDHREAPGVILPSLSLCPLPSGTENPAEEDDRLRVAVNDGCGGSYCVTQRWVHDHDIIHNTKGTDCFHMHVDLPWTDRDSP